APDDAPFTGWGGFSLSGRNSALANGLARYFAATRATNAGVSAFAALSYAPDAPSAPGAYSALPSTLYQPKLSAICVGVCKSESRWYANASRARANVFGSSGTRTE